MYIIYQIKCLVNNKVYIGYTSRTPEERFREHLLCKLDTKFYRALRKYGKENFTVSLLEQFETKKDALVGERLWISKLDTIENGYNTHEGGLGGKTKTEEQLQALSESMSGSNNPMFGKSQSLERRKLQSQKMKEYYKREDPETKKNRLMKSSMTQKGKSKNPESIEKMRHSQIKRHKKNDYRRCFYIITSPNGETVSLFGKEHLSLWCKENNKSLWTIERVLLKNRQPKGGNLVGWKAEIKSRHQQLAYT
jgi:group I intron endonuclease